MISIKSTPPANFPKILSKKKETASLDVSASELTSSTNDLRIKDLWLQQNFNTAEAFSHRTSSKVNREIHILKLSSLVQLEWVAQEIVKISPFIHSFFVEFRFQN